MDRIKTFLKNYIPGIIYSLLKEWKSIPEIMSFRRTIYNINKTKKDHMLPRIVFILQFPETWNSLRTVYEAGLKNGSPSIVLCIHKPFHSNWIDDEKCNARTNEAYQYCLKNNIQAVNAYNPDNDSWYDIQEFEPDYVFYTRPYNEHLPIMYRTTSVSKYAKVCHIPYGADMGSKLMNIITLKADFIRTTYIEFPNSLKTAHYFDRRFSLEKIIGANKCVYLGFPRFDLIKRFEKSEMNYKYTILWLPRWCVGNNDNNYESHFFEYIEPFLLYMGRHKDINLIIRPHPLMFGEIIRRKIMTQAEVEKLRNLLLAQENIILDENKDYLNSLSTADILVSDFSSLVLEFFMTGRPVIYCDNQPDDIDDNYVDLYKSFYLAQEWQNVEEALTNIINGNDDKYKERDMVKKKMKVQDDGNIGEGIYQYLVKDFKQCNQ